MNFWERHPALSFGLTALFGTLFTLHSPLALIPLILLLSMNKKRVFMLTLFFLFPIAYLYQIYTFPESGTHVAGRFHIKSVQETRGFSKGWSYRGVLKTDKGHIHCQMYSKTYYPANRNYLLTGLAYSKNSYFYTLKTLSCSPIPKSFNLSHSRYRTKSFVKAYIQKHIPNKRASLFLTGMVTGELEDQVMRQEFSFLGISHIMAISGFHFALLTLAFHLILRQFLSFRNESIVLLGLLTLYLLFIGDSPSIQRAWIVATIFLLGRLLERPPNPLNSLGLAMLLAIIYNPLSAITLSFQLSFLATAGILLLYHPLNHLIKLWIPTFPYKEVLEKHILWQHSYLITSLLRRSLALTLAVHLALLPLLIAYFHTFSFNSLIYNLFFPFCASIALFLFLIGIVTGGLLHPINEWYCRFLLSLTQSPPLIFKTFYFSEVPGWLVVIYLCLIFSFSIFYFSKRIKAYQLDLNQSND